MALIGAALIAGGFIGFALGCDTCARLDQPPEPPGRLERIRIRWRRRKEFAERRAEFVRTGALAPRRTTRVETW
ncbi:MAG TPA: hypothetical protein VF062_22270 [Candidatus Limnocylindrales bacterium]